MGSREPAHKDYKLSVLIPCYNEKDTIEEIVRRVQAVDVPTEIVIVDDGSTDGTRDILRRIEPDVDQVIFHEKNLGKGGAIQTGAKAVTGDYVVIQDADLEYDPEEYPLLLQSLLSGKADVVYGSRFLSGSPHRVHMYWHRVANGILTLLSNMVTNLNLTDMETCYKVFKTDVLRTIDLSERGFGIEPQITARISQLRCVVYEIGISYYGRGYEDGKKIGWKDAVWALYCIFKYGFLSRQRTQLAPEFVRAGAPAIVREAEQINADKENAEKEKAESEVATLGAGSGATDEYISY